MIRHMLPCHTRQDSCQTQVDRTRNIATLVRQVFHGVYLQSHYRPSFAAVASSREAGSLSLKPGNSGQFTSERRQSGLVLLGYLNALAKP
jgi:hypothetical protein